MADRGAAGLDIAWPAEVTGYLSLELDPDSSRLGLVHLEGEDLVPVVVPNGAPRWIDAVPRRWSRARLSGLDGVRAVRVEELPTRAVADLLRPAPAAPAGLFGIHPPPLRTPLMQQVRREVQEAD